MNIGIDIDGVLTDYDKFVIDEGTKYCFEINEGYLRNIGAYSLNERYDWTTEITNNFWKKNTLKYSVELPARDYAADVIQKLRSEGNNIFIITARRNEFDNSLKAKKDMNNIVKQWLENNNIKYDHLIFSPEDKRETCINNNIDIMIEDSPINIKELSQHISVICYYSNYNNNKVPKNVTICYSWYDIYSKLKKIN